MADKKGCFVTPEEIDGFLEDLPSDFEVCYTYDESEDDGKSLVLLIGNFTEYSTFLEDFFTFEKAIFW